jgi:hypothetical protein
MAAILSVFVFMRIEVAYAAFVSTVEFRMGEKCNPRFIGGLHSFTGDPKTKLGSMPECATKNIIVLNPPVQIVKSANHWGFNFVGGYNDSRAMPCSLRTDQGVSEYGRIREVVISRYFIIKSRVTDVYSSLPRLGRRFGEVGPVDFSGHRNRGSIQGFDES